MDTKPLAGSMNPVTSNGIFEALQEKQSKGDALEKLRLKSATAESEEVFEITVDDNGVLTLHAVTADMDYTIAGEAAEPAEPEVEETPADD